MGSEEENETDILNPHTPAPPTEKVWLPVYLDDDGKLAKHDWCLDTGIIKNQGGEEAKPKGFYVLVLNKMRYILKKDLGHEMSAPKLPESQISLILKDLDKIEGFYDKWWRTESSQIDTFIRIVQHRRPDISEKFNIATVVRT